MTRAEVKRTEIVWPGKYDESGMRREVKRVELPFQVIETINESRATRKHGKQLTLYDMWFKKKGDTFEEGWKNKLIWGENKLVMSSLVRDFAGKINLIYIDPPFATGADFKFRMQVGEENKRVKKEHSIIEEKAYRDTWRKGIDSYLQMICERLVLMKELLAKNGTIYVHLDWHVGHYVKVVMDEIFGRKNFRNEIVWHYRTGNIATKIFRRSHDIILCYVKNQDICVFNPIEVKEYYKDIYGPGFKPSFKGRKQSKDKHGIYRVMFADDTWDISAVFTLSDEHLFFDTQKPEALLKRIIYASSNPGDLVADFFCGSGTTLAVAEKMGRRWIGCDLSRWPIHITRKRLLEIPDCKPFELLNLGKYERKYWQTITFGKSKKHDEQLTIFEYLKFILKLYGAEPLSGMQHIHGKKGRAVIHVGAVDAPVTIDEINACLDECEAINQKELHILGWEWEMGLYDLITEAAKGRGIKLILFTIPREIMERQVVEKGDIQFYELAYLQTAISQKENQKVVVEIKDFVIPNYELLPEEVRENVKKWSDYIDYWAIDWDFRNDTFMNGWVAYRTRKNRKLPLKSNPHKYNKPGKYTIMAKVVDIFGTDTSQAFEVEVK